MKAAETGLAAALQARGATVIEEAVARTAEAHRRGWVERGRLAFFGRGRRHVGDGRAALARVELARAELELAEAERVYEGELARPGAAAEAAEAALWRGVALLELGRRGE